VGIAIGAEHRQFEIDDQPGFYSSNNLQWGLSSAVDTVGEDKVSEVFGELELPVLKGQPFFEELTLNLSGRYFDYDSYGSDNVYKAGLNWQINPLFRVRATMGNSYRAPALYELYLGNSTSFGGQLAIDPCNFTNGEAPANPNVAANCAAEGLDVDQVQGSPTFGQPRVPGGSSALIIAGGGVGTLEAETSDAATIGVIFTPTGINLSLALDYFDIAIDNQVARLGGASILGGCYSSDTFPTDPLCDLFTRDTDPNSPRFQQILEIQDNFVNINSQSNRGLDLTGRYEHEFSFGDLVFDVQSTWTLEDEFLLFSGEDFAPDLINGLVGEPSFTANARMQFQRGDWRYNWFTDFVGNTSNERLFGGDEFTFGSRGPGLFKYKVGTEAHWEHGASIQYTGDTWGATLGVSNIFDETPPALTTGTATRRGLVPLIGTQYDYRGRSVFARISKTF
jgi:iron complex outermembrane receptor protein